eukprot:5489206-Prorocentrum_lima.AAC.1
MTSSLVGSEMCIRDSNFVGLAGSDEPPADREYVDEPSTSSSTYNDPVSYTHLTLPTICSV